MKDDVSSDGVVVLNAEMGNPTVSMRPKQASDLFTIELWPSIWEARQAVILKRSSQCRCRCVLQSGANGIVASHGSAGVLYEYFPCHSGTAKALGLAAD